MKYTSMFIGAFAGLLSTFGYLAMNVKKSQRDSALPFVAVSLTVFGGVVGYKVGSGIERTEKIDKCLGLDKVLSSQVKVGRYWQARSSWADITNGRHEIKTLKVADTVSSFYNDDIICHHGNSASSLNITKYHKEACAIIFKALRERLDDECIALLDKRNS